jgi:hypothetical protein
MNANTRMVVSLYDGERTSTEIAAIVGLSPRYVRRIAEQRGLPRVNVGAQPGEKNHQYVSGRRIDPDGYVLVTAPQDHPYARQRTHRKGKLMFEHRLVLEKKLGRYLLPGEVVDHIDGLTLHNNPLNLRLFEGNGDHLRETITGLPKRTSVSGIQNIKTRFAQPEGWKPVDMFYLRRARGDVRLRAILLAALRLGIDSHFLLGSSHWTRKAQIDMTSRPTIEHALAELNQRWEQDLSQ